MANWITWIYQSNALQYVKTYQKEILKDIWRVKSMPKDIYKTTKNAWKESKTTGKQYPKRVIKTAGKAVHDGLRPHLPGLFAGIGTILPVPFSGIIGYQTGKLLQYIC